MVTNDDIARAKGKVRDAQENERKVRDAQENERYEEAYQAREKARDLENN